MIALVFALGLIAQEGPPPPLDAPRPVEEPTTPEKPKPLAPPRVDEKPRPDPKARPPVSMSNEPLDPIVIGILQWITPCGVSLLLNPVISLGAAFCPPLACALCLVPAATGYVAAYIGDRYGPGRAPAIWPVIAAYVASAVALVALVVGYYALIGGTLSLGQGQGQEATTFLILFGSAVVAGGLSTLGIPLSYAFTAEEKRAGDDGTALPGWFEPGHPQKKGPRYIPRSNDAPAPLEAMAY